jgi:AraC family transcriptional regulator, ethanolamine operon transcriptional activator
MAARGDTDVYRRDPLMEANVVVQAAAAPSTHDGDVAPYSMTRVTSSDIDDQAANLTQWKQVYAQMTPGHFVGSVHEVCFGGVQVFRETTSQAVHESGAPWTGSRAVGVPMRVEGAALFRGQAVDSDALVTLGGDDELDFYTPRGFDILGFAVDERELEAHARQIEHCDIAAAFDGKCVLKTDAGRRDEFRRLLLSVLQSLDANPAAAGFRQTQRVLQQSLLCALVAVAVEADDNGSPKPPCPSRQHVVDAAKAYMRDRIDRPITVADLCVELGVSRRTLQYSFQQVLGLNPVRYLRALRLNGVRRELKHVARGTGSVLDIAAKWGFWHAGHFVTDYKRMFNELPSETLHRKDRPARVQ